jgi:hypothetical protein
MVILSLSALQSSTVSLNLSSTVLLIYSQFTSNYNFFLTAPIEPEIRQPCNPTPCGANAECRELNGAGSCTCLPEYHGDPYTGCRPECVQNSDCDRTKACVNNKCKDPCPGVCGINAECRVQNHGPICLCLIGYEGDPTRVCTQTAIGELQLIFLEFLIIELCFCLSQWYYSDLLFLKPLQNL